MTEATPIPEMTETPQSSNVAAIGYDGTHLHVKFKSGGHYVYENVPAEKHADLMKAESIGKYINAEIKGKFTHRRLP